MRWLWRWFHMITLRRRQRGLGELRIVQGDGQTGVIGATLPIDLKVQAIDSGGHPVAGLVIQWDYQGDGTTDATSTTDALGIATTTAILGAGVGLQPIIATVRGQSLAVTFTATATGAAAASIFAVSSTSQSVTAGSPVSSPPSVQVLDASGNPFAGQAVVWAVASGGGSIDTTGATTTNAAGVATLVSWTTGASAGANTVTATAAGLTGSPVTFLANGTAIVPTTLAINGGNNQTGVEAGTYGADLTVLVTGAGAVPVPGVTVSWAAVSGGGLVTVTSLTNASGIATGIPLTGVVAGTNTYTAGIALGSGALAEVTFTITTVAGAAAQVALTTEPSPNCASGTALPGQPVAAVQDVNGNTVTTASGTMTATITAGDGTLSGDTVSIVNGVGTFTALTITDANGGTDLLHFSNGTFGVDASTATTVAPPVPDRIMANVNPSGAGAGLPLPTSSVRVADTSNVNIPGYTGQIQVAVASGPGTLSGTTTVNCVNAVATFTGLSLSAAGSYTFTYSDPAGGLTSYTSPTFTVTTPSATWPNDPGNATIAEHDSSTAPTSAISALSSAGHWVLWSGSTQSVTDATRGTTAPISSPRIWQTSYSAAAFPTYTGPGSGIGGASCSVGIWGATTVSGSRAEVDDLFLGFYFNAFGDGTTFEMVPQLIKPFGFLAYGQAQNFDNPGYWTFASNAAIGAQVSTLTLQFRQQQTSGGGLAVRAVPGTFDVTVNRWYRYEMRAIANTSIGAGGSNATSNGTLQQRITDMTTGVTTLFCNRSDMAWKCTGATHGFHLWKLNNTYGGSVPVGTPGKTRTDYILFDNFRMAGA